MMKKKKPGKAQKPGIPGHVQKLLREIGERWSAVDKKRLLMLNIPYVIVFYLVDKLAWLFRYCTGDSLINRLGVLFLNVQLAFKNPLLSFHLRDIAVGLIGAVAIKVSVYLKGKNAKKFRQGEEYGSARWSA